MKVPGLTLLQSWASQSSSRGRAVPGGQRQAELPTSICSVEMHSVTAAGHRAARRGAGLKGLHGADERRAAHPFSGQLSSIYSQETPRNLPMDAQIPRGQGLPAGQLQHPENKQVWLPNEKHGSEQKSPRPTEHNNLQT